MIFIDKMKPMKIYKKPLFLPTLEKDKKKKSALLMLTPNYESSKKIMTSPMFINKLRFQSYFYHTDVSYYISGKEGKKYEEDEYVRESTIEEMYQSLVEMSAKERNRLSDSDFGLPSKRKYPLDSEKHVRSAIRFFNYVDKEDEVELAGNINKAIKKFNIVDIKVGTKNRFYNFYQPINESSVTESYDIETPIDNLSSFIRFSGYAKDIEEVAKIVTPKFLYTLTQNLKLSIESIKDIPVLVVNVGLPFVEDVDYSECDHVVIPVFVTEIKNIAQNIYRQVIEFLHPSFKGTCLTDILIENIFAENSYYAKYSDYIFKDLNMNLSDYYRLNTIELINILRNKFPNINIKDLEIAVKESVEYASMGMSSGDTFNSSVFEESDVIDEDGVIIDNKVFFFNEAENNYDSALKKMLYMDRIKKRTDIVNRLKLIKEELPFIKYAFPDLTKYQTKNVFYDLYYYNELFFKNSTLAPKKQYEAYTVLLNRLLNNPEIKRCGYEKKTIVIPILDWTKDRSTRMWIYREGVNPISVIFELMRLESPKLKEVFGDTDVIFLANDKYFKLNFSTIEEYKKTYNKLRLFITKIIKGEEFDFEDVDSSMDTKESPEVIKANLIDKIELAKGVDLTQKVADADNRIKTEKLSSTTTPVVKNNTKANSLEKPVTTQQQLKNDIKTNNVKLSIDANVNKLEDNEIKLNKMASTIAAVSNSSNSTDDALDDLDNDEKFKELLTDINNMDDGNVDIDSTRASRINQLCDEFLDKSVNGKSVKELLSEEELDKKLEETNLNIPSPNKAWSTMKYMNFDKDYDIDADIIACFYHFSKVSKPVAIRNMTVEDHSTSEDRLDRYIAEMEDYKGKRFTIKLDIPKMKDNRLLLRGNEKAIQTQLFNMPIIKTDFDTCQIVSNYQKIFIYQNNNTVIGRSNSITNAISKALDKCEDKNIIVEYGENGKVSNKYELPVDYIDLANKFTKITTPNHIIYFDQDMIRKDYPDIDIKYGVPIGYDKNSKSIMYYNMEKNGPMVSTVIAKMLCNDSKKFEDLFNSMKWATSGTYSRCRIFNTRIPLVVICAYLEGLSTTLNKAKIEFTVTEKLPTEIRNNLDYLCIKFSDGYLYCKSTYESNMLLNGFGDCSTEIYSITDIDNKNMYYEFLDNFGGRIRADGLDNFYDCLVDPMTLEVLKHYKLPTDFVSILLYANALLCDNKFIRHTDTSSRRIRRAEQIAAYTYEALSEAYGYYSNAIKHGAQNVTMSIKETAVIDKIMMSQISADDTTVNALGAVETTNAITYKGKAGLNSERSYSLDKRVYDSTMINVLGASTGFSANVGMTRQTTMDMNVEGTRGYIKQTNGDTSQMCSAKSLCATEAVTPFGTTHDDSMRTCMTFIQTSKHMLRTVESDPLLVTCGADDALPYLTLDKFAFKAKEDGKILEVTDEYIIVEYVSGKKDYINLNSTVEKNSAGGFYVPLKLEKSAGLKVDGKFKAGSVLAYDNTSFSNSVGEADNISYNIGKLSKVAVINTDDGFEDSGFCTERLSRALTAKIITQVDSVIDKDCNIFSYAKIGDRVEPEDALIVWQSAFDDEEASVISRSLSIDADGINELGRKSIRSNISGIVKDIKIYRTVEIEDLSPSLQKLVKAYEAPIKQLKKKLDSEGIPSGDLPATYKLEPVGKLKRAQEAILIEFYLEYEDKVAIGDKIVYFAANKAVIKNVIPDNLAPTTDFRPKETIDAFVSQVSIDKRIVTSSLITGCMNKLLIEMDRSVKDILGIKYDESKL